MNAAVHTASLTYFAKTCAHMGEGGSIPFMRMLLDMFPAAQFLVTGAAGPGSNMHAPNEFLHIDYSARIAMCVAQVVATLATQPPSAASGEGAAAQAAAEAAGARAAGAGAATATATATAKAAVAAAAGAGVKKSFLETFKQSGGNGIFFVGCDCGKSGCVIFDQGMEKVCRPTKAAKV